VRLCGVERHQGAPDISSCLACGDMQEGLPGERREEIPKNGLISDNPLHISRIGLLHFLAFDRHRDNFRRLCFMAGQKIFQLRSMNCRQNMCLPQGVIRGKLLADRDREGGGEGGG
jgi:hypothetical protein